MVSSHEESKEANSAEGASNDYQKILIEGGADSQINSNRGTSPTHLRLITIDSPLKTGDEEPPVVAQAAPDQPKMSFFRRLVSGIAMFKVCPPTGMFTVPFMLLMTTIILSSFPGMFMAGFYKVYGLQKGLDDRWLSIAGAVAVGCNGALRCVWAKLYHKIGFRGVIFVTMAAQLVVAGTVEMITWSPALFTV